MTDYSEEEKIEMLRKWWAENGTSLVVAVLLAVAALVGWRQWQVHQAQTAAQASVIYQGMLDAVSAAQAKPDSKVEMEKARAGAEKLISDYDGSAYADYGRLLLARLAVENADYDKAAEQLQQVIKAPASDTIKWVATLRLARLDVQKGDLDAAEKLISGKLPEAFAGQAGELKGDILVARKDLDGARKAYTEALDKMQTDAHKRLVQMKIQDLAPAS